MYIAKRTGTIPLKSVVTIQGNGAVVACGGKVIGEIENAIVLKSGGGVTRIAGVLSVPTSSVKLGLSGGGPNNEEKNPVYKISNLPDHVSGPKGVAIPGTSLNYSAKMSFAKSAAPKLPSAEVPLSMDGWVPVTEDFEEDEKEQYCDGGCCTVSACIETGCCDDTTDPSDDVGFF